MTTLRVFGERRRWLSPSSWRARAPTKLRYAGKYKVALHMTCDRHWLRSVQPICSTRPAREACPQALIAFLEAVDYEDAIRNAISLGGDADTQACIAGGIAEARFGLPKAIAEQTLARLPEQMRVVYRAFRERFQPGATQ